MRISKRTLVVLLVLKVVVVLLLAACSSGYNKGNTGSGGTTPNQGNGGTQPMPGSPNNGGSGMGGGSGGSSGGSGSGSSGGMMTGTEVLAHNFAFAPQTLEVRVGDTVTFRNGDDADHEVEIDGKLLGRMKHGETLTWRAEKAGTFDYFCPIHPQMTGTIVVK